jgi:hypothetical protein
MIFTFGALVKIIAGFYIGCIGIVTDASYRGFGVTHYKIDARCKTETDLVYSVTVRSMNGFGHIEVVKATQEEWQAFK